MPRIGTWKLISLGATREVLGINACYAKTSTSPINASVPSFADGLEWKILDTLTRWSGGLNIPRAYVLIAESEPVVHLLKIQISQESNAKSKEHGFPIRKLLVTEKSTEITSHAELSFRTRSESIVIRQYCFLPLLFLVIASLLGATIAIAASPPEAYGPVPTEEQMVWHRSEMIGLICLGLNTYTDQEWGFGDIPVEQFNPTELDTDQWVTACKAAGMRGLVLVAKHHDGFCLCPPSRTRRFVAVGIGIRVRIRNR